MYCNACGTQNDDNVKFCKKCGSPVAAEAPTAKAPEPATPAAPGPKAKDQHTGPEKAALVLGICGAALSILAIPLLSWFALPCGLVGFIFSYKLWLLAKRADEMVGNYALAGIVLSGFTIINHLVDLIASSIQVDALGSAIGAASSLMDWGQLFGL